MSVRELGVVSRSEGVGECARLTRSSSLAPDPSQNVNRRRRGGGNWEM